MRVLVTGGAGMLGRRLITELLALGVLPDSDGALRQIEEIIAFDVVEATGMTDSRVKGVAGDLTSPGQVESLVTDQTSTIVHLAAVVSAQAEQDFELGMRVNIDATRALLERVRSIGHKPRLLMTSSVAVFGGELPAIVPDNQVWAPRSSYGTQKAISDLLLADYSRRGFCDGRSLRMPTIVVRPGRPNRAASSFASSIIREPVNGEDAICPVAPETQLCLMSPNVAIQNILHGLSLPANALTKGRVINMPGLSITVGDMLASLRRVCGAEVVRRVRMQPDPTIEAIVNSWPGDFSADYAKSLSFKRDPDFDSIPT
jgi:nucleoside-diphosphate-sugar epimerase